TLAVAGPRDVTDGPDRRETVADPGWPRLSGPGGRALRGHHRPLKPGRAAPLNCLVQRTVALAMARSRPRVGELEVPDRRSSSEVSTVVGHEDQPRLTGRQRQEDGVPKLLRQVAQRQPFASYDVGQGDRRFFPL